MKKLFVLFTLPFFALTSCGNKQEEPYAPKKYIAPEYKVDKSQQGNIRSYADIESTYQTFKKNMFDLDPFYESADEDNRERIKNLYLTATTTRTDLSFYPKGYFLYRKDTRIKSASQKYVLHNKKAISNGQYPYVWDDTYIGCLQNDTKYSLAIFDEDDYRVDPETEEMVHTIYQVKEYNSTNDEQEIEWFNERFTTDYWIDTIGEMHESFFMDEIFQIIDANNSSGKFYSREDGHFFYTYSGLYENVKVKLEVLVENYLPVYYYVLKTAKNNAKLGVKHEVLLSQEAVYDDQDITEFTLNDERYYEF